MTVKAMQRTPDEDTLERHDYTYTGVERVEVKKEIYGGVFLHLIFSDGRGLHLSVSSFDFEVEN